MPMNYSSARSNRNVRRRKITSWLALSALILNLIVGVSVPMAEAGALTAVSDTELTSTIIICTPNGLRTIVLDANGNPLPDNKSDADLCAFCLPLNGGQCGTVNVPLAVVVSAEPQVRILSPEHVRQTRYSISLTSRPPRAPPAFS